MLCRVEPLKTMEDIICMVRPGYMVRTELDLKAAFWQLSLCENDRYRCAAVTEIFGTLLCNRLPMGAKDSSSILENRVREFVIRPVQNLIKESGRSCTIELFRDNVFLSRKMRSNIWIH
jgi:hypothetical protein